ncbi:FO synthase subunit 1 [Durusdinium trenchii]|uniref:FO synthase subunit 1 n=1 Tax=Durusdinium trenchii TaxID=1381693 RepID=A0ABP0S1Q8_9DINO
MLPYRTDYGLRGTSDDVQRLLSQLIMLNGLCTNSDVPGTEKMVVTSLDDGWLKSPRNFLSVSDIGAHKGLLPPESVFMVKGWNRGVCGIICMLAAVECEDLRKARHWEVLNNAASFAAAYQIGRTEAGAATNLLTAVSESTREQLMELDGLAAGIFNSDYNGGTGVFHQWQKLLGNSQDLVDTMIKRMRLDFESLNAKMRKPWNQEQLQRVCGGYCAAMARFKELVPNKYYDDVNSEICATFMNRHTDADVLSMLQNSVPPIDIGRIDVFKTHLAKYHQKVDDDKATKAAEPLGENPAHFVTIFVGAISVDESLALVQAICGGNSSTLGFVLMPSFDLQEISLVYNESTHGGDRRKTNQQCLAITSGNHKHIEWTKSKIMLGSITGVDRSRVNELQNPEEDRPLAPHWRVQQRGIDASKAILKKLLEGLQLPENAPILVVDCLPNRFGEWSQACAQLQLAYVLGQDKSVSWNYMGIVLGDDAGIMHSLSSKTAGQFMANWWDVSQEAGPKRRSRTPFSEPVPTMEILAVANGQCKKLQLCV